MPQAFGGFDDVKAVSGPMARNVADLALLLDAMCGQHPRYIPALPLLLEAALQVPLGSLMGDQHMM